MASLRDIRSKIRAVKNIQQITQAMKMVAAARLRRAQMRVTAGKPYAEKMREMVSTLGRAASQIQHPLLERREGGAIALVVVSSDKGFCGSYNNNIIRRGAAFVAENKERGMKLITVGKKSGDFYRRRNYDMHASFSQIGVDAPYSEVKAIADSITGIFLERGVNEVYVAYTEFLTTIQQRPTVVKFLPIEPPQETEEHAEAERRREQALEYIFEPPAEKLLATLLPRYVDAQIYHMLLESVASEFGARMTAMTNATENAGELIDNLTLNYNKARQASITKELLEVVSGAEALRAA